MAQHCVLFVCTGNICRSPMAEYLFRARAGDDSPWEAVSAGIIADFGYPASAHAQTVLREMGIDLSRHQSQPVRAELIERADVIVAMTSGHRAQLWAMFRELIRDKVFLLKEFSKDDVPGDVDDPIGGSIATYRAVRDELDEAMPGLVEFLDRLKLPAT